MFGEVFLWVFIFWMLMIGIKDILFVSDIMVEDCFKVYFVLLELIDKYEFVLFNVEYFVFSDVGWCNCGCNLNYY